MLNIKELLTKPLGFTEILIILLSLAALIFLLAVIDICHQKVKTTKFIIKNPNAAIVYILSENQHIKNAQISCSKGTVSKTFWTKAPFFSHQNKALAFYVLPGLTDINILVNCKKGIIQSHTFSFNAEEKAVYEASFNTQSRHCKIRLIKGTDFYFERENNPAPYTPKHGKIWSNSNKMSIIPFFYSRELKRLLTSTFCLLLLITYLVFYGNLKPYLYLLPLFIFVMAFILMITKGTRNFNKVFNLLSEYEKALTDSDFKKLHTVYKLFMGDVHLLSSCLIARHGGSLSIIPYTQIESVRGIKYSKTYGLAKSLIITLNTGKKYQLEFMCNHINELNELSIFIQSKNNKVHFF